MTGYTNGQNDTLAHSTNYVSKKKFLKVNYIKN